MTKIRTGFLVVISGPSGCGKSTLCSLLTKEQDLKLGLVVSHTSRERRKTEENGREYFFIDVNEFEERREKGFYLETACVHGNYYGTPRDQVDAFLKEGKIVLLEIDVQGGLQVQKNFPEAVLIFVSPPTFDTLEQRLNGRGTDSAEIIDRRVKNAVDELVQIPNYDYLVLNDELSKSVQELKNIIHSEKYRVSRLNIDILFGTMRVPGYCERT